MTALMSMVSMGAEEVEEVVKKQRPTARARVIGDKSKFRRADGDDQSADLEPRERSSYSQTPMTKSMCVRLRMLRTLRVDPSDTRPSEVDVSHHEGFSARGDTSIKPFKGDTESLTAAQSDTMQTTLDQFRASTSTERVGEKGKGCESTAP